MMTQPTTIFLGPDGKKFESSKNKIFLRTLLYSTSKRGQVIESLHVSIQRNESRQNFNIWVYGEIDDLKRGSGLYVPPEGVTFNHHFMLPKDGANFDFLSGEYKVVVFATLVGNRSPIELFSIDLDISNNQAEALNEVNTGIFYDWGPDKKSYHSHIDVRPEQEPSFEIFKELMANKQQSDFR